MPRYKLTIEYDGSGLVGWQRQPNGLSVQEALETAIAGSAGRASRSTGLGAPTRVCMRWPRPRISISPATRRPTCSAAQSTIYLRPPAISVLAAETRRDDFDARLSATGRVYLYRILNRRAPPALERGRVWQVTPPLDLEAMRAGARHLSASRFFDLPRLVVPGEIAAENARRAGSRPVRRRDPYRPLGLARSCIIRCATSPAR